VEDLGRLRGVNIFVHTRKECSEMLDKFGKLRHTVALISSLVISNGQILIVEC
jgi:hypothetical protein